MTRHAHRALLAHVHARTVWARLRPLLNRVRHGVDDLIDNGLALDFIVAAIGFVVVKRFVPWVGAAVATVVIGTFVAKGLRIRLERFVERESGHPSARKWGIVGAGGLILLLEQKGASAAHWLLGKLGLSTGQAHGAINTGGLASQAAATAAATVLAFGAVQGAQAVIPDGQPHAEIVAIAPLTLEDWENFPSLEAVDYLMPVPANATKPDGIVRSCGAPILGVYVQYDRMEEETRVEHRSYLDDELFAPDEFVYESEYPYEAARLRDVQGSYYGEKSPSGDPLPSGEWRLVVFVDGEKTDEANVTLKNETCP